MGSEESEESMEFLEFDPSEQFGEDIADHVIGRAIVQYNVARGDHLADEVKMNINMLCASMECGILRKMDGALVVTEKCSWYCKSKNRR